MGSDSLASTQYRMQKFLSLALLVGAASALPPMLSLTREQVDETFGKENVNWDPNVRVKYCNNCVDLKIASTGGALEHAPNRLGNFNVAGALWENTVPFFEAANGQYLTPDPNSNPIIYYIKWVVSESVGGLNAGIQNEEYTNGVNCPWDIPDNWEYEYDRQWYVDPTLRVTCVIQGQRIDELNHPMTSSPLTLSNCVHAVQLLQIPNYLCTIIQLQCRDIFVYL